LIELALSVRDMFRSFEPGVDPIPKSQQPVQVTSISRGLEVIPAMGEVDLSSHSIGTSLRGERYFISFTQLGALDLGDYSQWPSG
jgi:hypothetical protein